jgi:hypothetical protein
MHDGFRMPMGFPVENFNSALTYEARPNDVFISTYPKCGTTWMQHMVWLILHQGEPLSPDMTMTQAIPHLEEVGAQVVGRLPDPRVIKTHLPFERTPHNAAARFIYVVRNPFDCAVSFYHHTRGFVKHYDFADGTFDDYFECFVNGAVDFGDYFENVLSWFAHIDDENFLLVTYEQMSVDSAGAAKLVGEFLGGQAGEVVNDASTLAKIVQHSSFENMAKDQQRWSGKRPDGMPSFVRKGVVGDWLNHFSPAHTRRMLARIDTTPGAVALACLWPDVMAMARARV